MNKHDDILSWESFNTNSKKLNKNLPSKVELYNRLIYHTKNFFVIAGYGSFNEGYLLIISKSNISSFSHLEKNCLDEFKWLKEFLSKILKKIYNKKISIFEHGMCSCAGGLDHAHLHLMPITNIESNAQFIQVVNDTLKRRVAGVHKIKYGDHYFSNPHDISTIIHIGKKNDYQIVEGRLLNIEDLQSNKKLQSYPEDTSNAVKEENQYIYFEVFENNYNFYTLESLGTQFGRELCYNLELCNNKNFFESSKNSFMNNPNKLIWRWQDYIFKDKILLTIKELSRNKDYFGEKNNIQAYEFKNIYD